MKTKPILFSSPMVQAILEGRKTQTRRIIPEKIIDDYYNYDEYCNMVMPPDITCTRTYEKEFYLERCKYSINDILWVRETFCPVIDAYTFEDKGFKYRADKNTEDYNGCWKPSIFMPKEAARIFLKVKNIRVERLHDISESDAIAEGIQELLSSSMQLATQGRLFRDYSKKPELFMDGLKPIQSFKSLWQSINGNWHENPFVWVYEFELTEKPENFIQ